MIKFFRHIRKDLIEQNKTGSPEQRVRAGKYLKYAIGEIVLVVIGIMIALSINNWYGDIKDRKEEAKILKSIKADLLTSKSKIQFIIKQQTRATTKTQNLIDLFDIYRSGVDKDSLVKANEEKIGEYLNEGVFQWFRAEPITGTYDALIGSGKTELILSDELRRKLAEYSTIVKSGFEDQATATSILSLIMEKQSKYVGLGVWNFKNEEKRAKFRHIDEKLRNKAIHSLLNDASFQGLLIPNISLEGMRLWNQKQLLKFTGELLVIIEKEIK